MGNDKMNMSEVILICLNIIWEFSERRENSKSLNAVKIRNWNLATMKIYAELYIAAFCEEGLSDEPRVGVKSRPRVNEIISSQHAY
jgi:hypothetical protein